MKYKTDDKIYRPESAFITYSYSSTSKLSKDSFSLIISFANKNKKEFSIFLANIVVSVPKFRQKDPRISRKFVTMRVFKASDIRNSTLHDLLKGKMEEGGYKYGERSCHCKCCTDSNRKF